MIILSTGYILLFLTDLVAAGYTLREEWRYTSTVGGVWSVTLAGISLMRILYADNLDL